MILGMSVAAFTQFHVILSLVGIASGIVVALAMLGASRMPVLTAIFLITTVATSATGFLFHIVSFGPPEIVGVISLVDLGVAVMALDLCRHGDIRVVPECFCRRGADFSKSRVFPRSRADANRTAVRRRAGNRIDSIHCARHRGGEKVSSRGALARTRMSRQKLILIPPKYARGMAGLWKRLSTRGSLDWASAGMPGAPTPVGSLNKPKVE